MDYSYFIAVVCKVVACCLPVLNTFDTFQTKLEINQTTLEHTNADSTDHHLPSRQSETPTTLRHRKL